MQDARFVRSAFAGIASRYVLANHVLSLGIDVLWRRKTARMALDWQPEFILDLATGSGDLARTLQGALPRARVLGVDFSVPMMRESQARGFQHLLAADALRLPVRDAAADLVTVAFGLRNMASWPEALREMSRVLKPGGHLMVLDFSLPRLPVVRQGYQFYLKHVMPRIAGAITGRREAYEYLCGSIERFPSGAAMEGLITANGFQSAQCHPLTLGIASLYVAQK